MRNFPIRKVTITEQIADQQRWIDEHGGDIVGYVARYGSKDDAKHYGDGGELIYAADLAALQKLRMAASRMRPRR